MARYYTDISKTRSTVKVGEVNVARYCIGMRLLPLKIVAGLCYMAHILLYEWVGQVMY